MSMVRIINNIRKDEKEFVNSATIKEYSRELFYHFNKVIDYLTSQGHIIKIFNDLYYVKDNDEFSKDELKYSLHELISKVLKFKKIENWYFGLYTALKLNLIDKIDDATEKNYDTNYIINNRISKDDQNTINGTKCIYLLFKESLMNFGVKENSVKYSDIEKTILDFIYLYTHNNLNQGKIINEISKYLKYASVEKLKEYSEYYPKNAQETLETLISLRK